MRKLKLDELGRISLADFRGKRKWPLIVVLDNIRSGLNVGSIFRTADAFAVEQMFLAGITPVPPHREIMRSALGATESVSWEYLDDLVGKLLELKKMGYTILGIEQTDQSIMLDQYHAPQDPLVLVLGNEVSGLSDEILPVLDHAIEIPQYGTKHSLNVAVCAGVVLWDLLVKTAWHSSQIT